ncbi:HAD-IA family hydrolase [Streptomyces sp. NPDC001389]|uniref:HAD-IA family hydrolase n=1 Tax=unclassified Streptomyces TaxID=2593676 RepID=UPI0036AE9A42
MAVACGSAREATDAALEGSGPDALPTTAVPAEEAGRGRPALDVFPEAARRPGAAPASCVVVEDAAPGALAARAAGTACLAVPDLAQDAGDPAFAGAGLLFAGGRAEFGAAAAEEWLGSLGTG